MFNFHFNSRLNHAYWSICNPYVYVHNVNILHYDLEWCIWLGTWCTWLRVIVWFTWKGFLGVFFESGREQLLQVRVWLTICAGSNTQLLILGLDWTILIISGEYKNFVIRQVRIGLIWEHKFGITRLLWAEIHFIITWKILIIEWLFVCEKWSILTKQQKYCHVVQDHSTIRF